MILEYEYYHFEGKYRVKGTVFSFDTFDEMYEVLFFNEEDTIDIDLIQVDVPKYAKVNCGIW